MDSLLFQAMAIELNRTLERSRLDRVIQTTAGTFVFRFWTGREKVQLLIRADGAGSFYLTRKIHPAPAGPPRFCQLLRARLRRLIELRTEPFDRIAHLIFSGPDEAKYDLIFEAFGSQGNLILVDSAGRIVDLLWRQEAERVLMPGEIYRLPEQRKRVSLFGEIDPLISRVEAASDQRTMEQIDVAPFSSAMALVLIETRAAGKPVDSLLENIQHTFKSGTFEACRVSRDGAVGLEGSGIGRGGGMLPFTYGTESFDSIERFDTLSEMVETVGVGAEQGSRGQESTRDLLQRFVSLVTKQRKKIKKRLTSIEEEIVRQAEPEQLRILGDLLLANIYRIPRGAEYAEVDDYYQTPVKKVTIELDKKISAQENAERYFKRYQKAKRARDHHTRRKAESEEELTWLDQVELALDEIKDDESGKAGDDLYQIQLELEDAGLLKAAKGQLGRRQTKKPEDQLHTATTPNGYNIYWGKNSRTNDYVSRRLTGPDDLWFHAHRMPGCHLVIKDEMVHRDEGRGQIPDEDIAYAASFAAGYSKGRGAGKVEVIIAKGRDVRKPKGARMGLVTVETFRTVMAVPKRLDDK